VANPEFILVRTELVDEVRYGQDTFFSVFSSAEERRAAVRQFAENVRRPMRGLQIKEETFATISVFGIGQTGDDVASPAAAASGVVTTAGESTAQLLNSSAPPETTVAYTSNFLLQGVSEQRSEKFQPITTFGATYGFFFGEQPRMVTFNATLLNTADFQWEIEWWANYEETLRGTRLVDKRLRVYMSYDDVILEGYILNAITNKSSQTPHEVNLTFTMWVTGVEYLIEPGSKEYPESDGLAIVDFAGGREAIRNQIGDIISTTAAVREANLAAAVAGPVGLLGKLRAALVEYNAFVGKIGQAFDNAVSFLFGRNLVIPAGFAGSPVFVDSSGNVVTLSGDEFDINNLGQLATTLNVKLPVNMAKVGQDVQPRTNFYDNVDEYPVRSGRQFFDTSSSQYFAAAIAAGPSDPDATAEGLDAMATKAAEDAFASFGIQITNMEGRARSKVALAMARAAWGAINLAASASGASQAAASVTVGSLAGGGTTTAVGGAGGSSTV
jgi:hypothetical protein